MDGCPWRGDPSFPGWIITLWMKFAFNCTVLRVIPCCGDKSPAGSLAHSLDSCCPGTMSSPVPTTHPDRPSCTPARYPAPVGWRVPDIVVTPKMWQVLRCCPQEASSLA